jgi:hypothetical protein
MEHQSLMNKLVRVERHLNVYRDADEELLEEIKIDLPIEDLKSIINPEPRDYMLYRDYL